MPTLKKDIEHECPSCGDKLYSSDVFCMHCGEFNPHFNIRSFAEEYEGKTLRDVMGEEGCESGHPEIQKDIQGDHEEIYRRYPYCSICGIRLAF